MRWDNHDVTGWARYGWLQRKVKVEIWRLI